MSDRNLPSTPSMEDFRALLRFESDEGRIWLAEERMVLMHSSEMRALRRELIESLGVERARRLLTRMGYVAGQRDAETARKVRSEATVYESFLLGPQSHMLTGQVKVTPTDLSMDVEAGRFYGEFLWENSFEAEAYEAEFGLSDEPVCWVQIGYASGYTTQFMGRQIVFREVQCAGCGDANCRIVGKPFEEWEDGEELIRYLQPERIAEEILELQSQVSTLRTSINDDSSFADIIGSSERFLEVCRLVRKVADSKVTVLLLGETGVGKDMFAKALHRESSRANEAFVAVNCAAIPKDLIEAELFGVEKGAFTGANQSRAGRFERAHRGTLFLDEVGELSPQAQAALLRVLQEGELERVGDTRTRKVDVRLVAATNENLEEAVREGRFRPDLLYRLNVYSVTVPPLRDRLDDLAELAQHFLQMYSVTHGKRLKGMTDKAMTALRAYDWPGNIRELGNVIERGVILAENDGEVEVSDLFAQSDAARNARVLAEDGHLVPEQQVMGDNFYEEFFSVGRSMGDLERNLMQQALQRSGGNVSKAAKLLGLTRPALDYRLRKAGLNTKP